MLRRRGCIGADQQKRGPQDAGRGSHLAHGRADRRQPRRPSYADERRHKCLPRGKHPLRQHEYEHRRDRLRYRENYRQQPRRVIERAQQQHVADIQERKQKGLHLRRIEIRVEPPAQPRIPIVEMIIS